MNFRLVAFLHFDEEIGESVTSKFNQVIEMCNPFLQLLFNRRYYLFTDAFEATFQVFPEEWTHSAVNVT